MAKSSLLAALARKTKTVNVGEEEVEIQQLSVSEMSEIREARETKGEAHAMALTLVKSCADLDESDIEELVNAAFESVQALSAQIILFNRLEEKN